MKRLLLIGLCVVTFAAVFSALFASCGTSETVTTAAQSTTTAPAGGSTASSEASTTVPSGPASTGPAGEQKVLKLGAIIGLTTANGLGIQNWLNVFVKSVNDEGGWKIGNDTYRLELTVYDCGTQDPSKTRAAVEKAVLSDGVKFLVGDFSDVVQVTTTITEPNKVLVVGLDMTGAGIDPKNQYFINGESVFFNAGMAYRYLAEYKNKGATKYITAGPDNDMIRAGIANQGAVAKLCGLEIAEPVFYNADTVDFGPVATKILSANPDFIDLSYTGGDQSINLISALKDSGYKGFLSPANMDQVLLDKAVKAVGKEYLEGAAIVSQDSRAATTDPRMKTMLDRFATENGVFDPTGLLWASSFFYLEDAVMTAQSLDASVLAQYLKKSTKAIMTPEGYSQLVARPDKQNFTTIDAVTNAYVGVIKDGKINLTGTVSLTDQYLASILAYGLNDVYKAYWDKYGKPEFPAEESLLDWSAVK